jgi:hypothetical protein
MPTVPQPYSIVVQGRFGSELDPMLSGIAREQRNGCTELHAPAIDQAALYGLLLRLRDLGAELVSVNRIAAS